MQYSPRHEEYVELRGEGVGEAESDEAGVDVVPVDDGEEGGEDDEQVREALEAREQPRAGHVVRVVVLLNGEALSHKEEKCFC